MSSHEQNITSLSTEKRLFKPKKAFSEQAHIKSFDQYKKMYSQSIKNPEKFWGKAAEELHWFKKWKKVLKWKPRTPSGSQAASIFYLTIVSIGT